MASGLWTRKANLRSRLEIADAICITIIASILFLTLIFRTGYVHGSSMESTIHEGDRYIISNLFYKPKQGDIVVFLPDKEQTNAYDNEKLYVKRVIATEGQRVQIKKDATATYKVFVDNVEINEPYLDDDQVTYPPVGQEEMDITVPDGYIFALGDNRKNSNDSRAIGCVDERRIIGHVIFRFYPFNQIGPVR